MFSKKNEKNYKNVLDKICQKTLIYGEKTLMAEFRLEKGAKLPAHSHPHEQTGYMVSGCMNLTIGGNTCRIEPGDSWCIHGDVEHYAEALEDSVAIEVFSPVREDYIENK